MKGVRELALRENTEISKVVNALLAEGLQRRKLTREKVPDLPSFRMGKSRVNLADRDALEAAMEG